MLVIRQEQIDLLAEDVRVRTAVEHVREFFPEECGALSEEPLVELVRRSLRSGLSYGLVAGDLLSFVDLVLLFGEGFDRKWDWARRILDDNDPARLPFRGARLFDRAMVELEKLEPEPVLPADFDESEEEL